MLNYDKIFVAHFKTHLLLMLWGSSGYGKTSLVKAFADKYKFDLNVLHAQYIDPLALFIPATGDMKELGYAKFYPADFLHRIFNAPQKTILFLDELTRAREETLNILTELLVDRKVFGYKLPPHVMIMAASNFPEEDSGVKDLPDAVMQRLTHIIHAPETKSMLQHIGSAMARKVATSAPAVLAAPGHHLGLFTRLRGCPRQLEACGLLAEVGLSGDELLASCRGRIGLEAGSDFAFEVGRLRAGSTQDLPTEISEAEFPRILSHEDKLGITEVVGLLKRSMEKTHLHKTIADYLLRHARPETCRSMQQLGFTYTYGAAAINAHGKIFEVFSTESKEMVRIDKPRCPWQYYAVKIGKLQSK